MSPSAPLRLLGAGHPLEREILGAEAVARGRSAERLTHLFGFDVATWLATDRDREPVSSHASSPALDRLGVSGAVAELLAQHDLGDDDATPTTARVVATAAGRDRDTVPEGRVVRRRPATGRPLRLAPIGLEAALDAGHSFKLRAVEVVSSALEGLVEDVERVTAVASGLMAYLSGPEAGGWGPHYDRHDGLIVQVEGSKRWTIFRPIEPSPLRPTSPYAVSAEVAWTGVLEPGDLLAIPRGWGHEAVGTSLRSLHLTIPIRQPDASEVLARALADPDHDPVEAVLAVRRAGIPSRSRLRLSLGAEFADGAWPVAGRLRLSAPGGVLAEGPPAAPDAWVVAGNRLPATAAVAGVLTRLLAEPSVAPGELPDDEARTVLAGLVRAGLVDVVSDVVSDAPPTTCPGASAVTGGVWPGVTLADPPAPARPLGGVRPPMASEAPAAAALAHRRDHAAEALHEVVPGLDLPSLLRTGRSEPRRAHLGEGARVLADPSAIDDLILTRDLSERRIAVAHGAVARNRPPAPDLYRATADPAAPRRLDPARLHEALRQGVTAIAFGVDDSWPAVSEVAALIEEVAGVRSGANLYLSHGRHLSGFGAHWDDHDVLVVQVAGTKSWSLHAPAEAAPVLGHSPEGVEIAGKPQVVEVLAPGDVLYVPRGWVHEVVGRGGLSAHLTFPVRRPTGAAVLAEAARRATETGLDAIVDTTDGTDLVRAATAGWEASVPARRRDRWMAPRQPDGTSPHVRLAATAGVAVHEAAPDGQTWLAMGGCSVPVADVGSQLLCSLLEGRSVPLDAAGDLAPLLDADLVDVVVAPASPC